MTKTRAKPRIEGSHYAKQPDGSFAHVVGGEVVDKTKVEEAEATKPLSQEVAYPKMIHIPLAPPLQAPADEMETWYLGQFPKPLPPAILETSREPLEKMSRLETIVESVHVATINFYAELAKMQAEGGDTLPDEAVERLLRATTVIRGRCMREQIYRKRERADKPKFREFH